MMKGQILPDLVIRDGKLMNIKEERLRKERFRLLSKKCILGCAMIGMFTTGIFVGRKSAEKDPYIPNRGEVVIQITDMIEGGMTVSELAQKYYQENGMYESLQDYVKHILNINGLTSISKVELGDTIQIPVTVSEDNEYYIQMLNLQKQIKEIEENELWVPYTIRYGDTLSAIASQASEDIQETYLIVAKIQQHNHITDQIEFGTTIEIMNPKLGPLKIALQEVKEHLEESLTQNQNKVKAKK